MGLTTPQSHMFHSLFGFKPPKTIPSIQTAIKIIKREKNYAGIYLQVAWKRKQVYGKQNIPEIETDAF